MLRGGTSLGRSVSVGRGVAKRRGVPSRGNLYGGVALLRGGAFWKRKFLCGGALLRGGASQGRGFPGRGGGKLISSCVPDSSAPGSRLDLRLPRPPACCSHLRAAASRPRSRGRRPEGCHTLDSLLPSLRLSSQPRSSPRISPKRPPREPRGASELRAR